MRRARPVSTRALWSFGLVSLVACGPAPPPPAAPNAEPEATSGAGSHERPRAAEPHIRDAAAEIERAQRALDEALGPAPGRDEGPHAAPDRATKKDGGPPGPPARPGDAPSDEPSKPRKATRGQDASGGGACDVACVALASMERATTYLCRLAGEDDPRCPSARARVRLSRERVQAAACPCASPEVPVSAAPPAPVRDELVRQASVASARATAAGESHSTSAPADRSSCALP